MWDLQVRLSCLETLSMIGQYNTTADELSAMLKLALPAGGPDEACPLTPPRARWLDGEDAPLDEDEEVRLGVRQAIAAISQRSCPKDFFHSNGLPGWIRVSPIVKFPAAKVGYSLSCWLRVSSFVGEESTLVRWLQHDGEQILELTFQKLGAAADTARCLSIRTHSGRSQARSQPFVMNVFNAQSFGADGAWHHMVFTHCQRTLGLWIDGKFVQSCAFTTYVSPPAGITAKEQPMTCYFCGGGGEGDSGGIRGDFSSILFTEGVWDARTVAAQYALGPLHDTTHTKQVGTDKTSDHKTIMVVSPSSCFKGRHHVDQKALGSSALSDMAGTLFDRFSKMSQTGGGVGAEDRDGSGNAQQQAAAHRSPRACAKDKDSKKSSLSGKLGEDVGDQHHGELGASMSVHTTQTLHEALRQIGGIALLLRLLAPGPEGSNVAISQVTSLRVLAQVLRDGHEEAVAEFVRLRGECVLLYVLSQCDTAEEEVFDALLQMACGKEATGIKHSLFVVLAMYLLQLSALDVRGKQKVLRWIDDRFLTAGNAGRQVWMATEPLGLRVLLNLARRSDVALYPAVVTLVQQTAPSWGGAELDELLTFILGILVVKSMFCNVCVDAIDAFMHLETLIPPKTEDLLPAQPWKMKL